MRGKKKEKQLSQAPLLFRNISHGIVPCKSLNRPDWFLEINGCDPAICLATSSDDLELRHFVVTEAMRPVGFLVSCCIDLPEDDNEVKEPCKEYGLQTCGFFHHKENVISYVCLVREFVANTHHTVTHIGLPLILNH